MLKPHFFGHLVPILAPISSKTASGYKSMDFMTPRMMGFSQTPVFKMLPETFRALIQDY